MSKHFYSVGNESFSYFIDAIREQSRLLSSDNVLTRIVEHYEDGSVQPHPHGFEFPKNIVGTKSDELQRMACETYNQ